MSNNASQPYGETVGYLSRAFGLERVRPVRLELYDRSSGNAYFEGWLGDERLFVKWGGKGEGCRSEFEFGKRLYELNQANFIRPRFCRCEADGERQICCLGMDYVESATLQDKLLAGALDDADKERVIRELVKMAETLLAAGCAHRDINPVNVVLAEDGRVLLVDLQFAVAAAPYVEQPDILANPRFIHFLGTGFFAGPPERARKAERSGGPGSQGCFKFGPDRFQWDDMYSLLQMLDYIGCSESYRETWEEARAFFSANLGRLAVSFPERERLLRRRKIFKLLSTPIPIKKWRDRVRMRYLQINLRDATAQKSGD